MTTTKKILLTAVLLLSPAPALAQSDTTTAPTTSGATDAGTAGTTGTTSTTDSNDRGFDYGWLGLLGLLGLAGLRRPAPHVVTTDRSTAQRP